MLVYGPQVSVNPAAWSQSRADLEAAWGQLSIVSNQVIRWKPRLSHWWKTRRCIPRDRSVSGSPDPHTKRTRCIDPGDHSRRSPRRVVFRPGVKSTIGFGCMCRRMTVRSPTRLTDVNIRVLVQRARAPIPYCARYAVWVLVSFPILDILHNCADYRHMNLNDFLVYRRLVQRSHPYSERPGQYRYL